MLKPSDYTPARRRIMQIALWAIFLVTLGLAGVVAETNRRANRIPLTQAVTVDGVTVRLPDQWRTRPRAEDRRTIVQASDAPPEGEPRTIIVLCDRLANPMSPLQYLNRSFGVSLPGTVEAGGEISPLSTLKIAGQPGVLVTILGPPGRQQEVGKDMYACTVLPSLRAVVVRLHGQGPVNPQDRELIRSVSASIVLVGEPGQVKEDEPITLPEGITLTPPRGLAAIEEKDPNRTDRRLWPVSLMKQRGQRLEENWATVELVGCIVPPHENMAACVETLLLVRDPVWRGANVIPEGPNLWRVELAKSSNNMMFPARAYLMSDANGIGLLAVFRGGFKGGGFEDDWKEIARSIKFPATPAVNVGEMESLGAAEATRLRDAGYEKLITERDEQWWLWTCPGDRPHLGWSHVDLLPNALAGKSETRLRRGGGVVRRIVEEFNYHDSGPRYRSNLTRDDAAGETLQSIQQNAALNADQLTMSVRMRGGSDGKDGATEQWKSTPPGQFVPGSLLPLVLGKLADKPMLIRAESFVGYEALAVPELLALLIEPGANMTLKAQGENKPMRCVTVKVNGSGQISRWYFRAGGELECVEMADGARRAQTDGPTVGFDFGKDGQMAP